MSMWEDVAADAYVYEEIIERKRQREAHKTFRTDTLWTTKDGRKMSIKDMTDRHLMNAYMMSDSQLLFKEMVLRLFEERISNGNV